MDFIYEISNMNTEQKNNEELKQTRAKRAEQMKKYMHKLDETDWVKMDAIRAQKRENAKKWYQKNKAHRQKYGVLYRAKKKAEKGEVLVALFDL